MVTPTRDRVIRDPILGMKLQNPPISAKSGHQGTCAIANPVAYRSTSTPAMMSCARIKSPRTRTDCRKGLPDGDITTYVPMIFVHLSLQPSLRARIVPPRPVRFRKRQAAERFVSKTNTQIPSEPQVRLGCKVLRGNNASPTTHWRW